MSQTLWTSLAASAQIRPTADTLRARVLEFIRSRAEGATDDEVQRALNMAGNTERPRRKELQDMGLVVESGGVRPTASGRQAVVWVAVVKGARGEPFWSAR